MVTKDDICVVRILGNYNPPRSLAKNRIDELKFILDKESDLNMKKLCVLNRIFDEDYLKEIKQILELNNQNYHEIDFNFQAFKVIKKEREKIHYYTNINTARNVAVKLGLLGSRYCVYLDGDCFFTKELFKNALDKINENPNYQYYGLMTKRMSDPGAATWITSGRLEKEASNEDDPAAGVDAKSNLVDAEAQLIFTRLSSEYFDEELVFGENDKNILLWKIGFNQEDMKHYNYNTKPKGDKCLVIGNILHVSFQDQEMEASPRWRKNSRTESLTNTIRVIYKQYSYKKETGVDGSYDKEGLSLIKALEKAGEISAKQARSLMMK